MGQRVRDADGFGGSEVVRESLDEHFGETGERRHHRWLPFLGLMTAACLLVAGSLTWLFWDDLMYPLGDPRACAGSDAALPRDIVAGGVSLPSDASEVRYYTHEGQAVVSFVSSQVPDYLLRAKLIPDVAPPVLDRNHGDAYGLGADDRDLPEGLCGEGLRGPAWSFWGPGSGSVLVERSPSADYELRTRPRVQVFFPWATANG
ncbi:hypothetical protein ACFY8F_34840 [Streptomyces tanashiensis]|uniref:hypothetical protein n=1 Tax=Streptomyces tanashiensis TaxID=67367 RepID=UPI0036AFA930